MFWTRERELPSSAGDLKNLRFCVVRANFTWNLQHFKQFPKDLIPLHMSSVYRDNVIIKVTLTLD